MRIPVQSNFSYKNASSCAQKLKDKLIKKRRRIKRNIPQKQSRCTVWMHREVYKNNTPMHIFQNVQGEHKMKPNKQHIQKQLEKRSKITKKLSIKMSPHFS